MSNKTGNTAMQVLLTGATGFLGRRVLRELVDEGCAVRCAVRPGSDVRSLREFVGSRRWNCTETVNGQLSSTEHCRELVRGCEVVYHAAAALSGSASNLVMSSVVPTRNLMNAASEESVNRFVLVSSLGVYGSQALGRNETLDEECPVDPAGHLRDPYTYSKILQEEISWEISREKNLPLVVVRPGVIFGDERGSLSHRVGLQVGGLVLRMGGRQRVPFTYVENCAEAVKLAGLNTEIDGQIFNIVDDDLPTGRQVLRRYRKAGRKLRVVGIPQFATNWLARFNEWYSAKTEQQIPPVLTRYRVQAMWKPLQYSNDRAKQQLGWHPSTSFDEAFERTMAFGA
jgi:nucleoside-diphosphate-sugar epimerase